MTDYKTLAQKYFGDDYANLTPKQHLERIMLNFSFDPSAEESARRSLERMDEETSEQTVLYFLRAYEALPQALETIKALSNEYKKGRLV